MSAHQKYAVNIRVKLKESANHISAITPKGLVTLQLELPKMIYKAQF